MFLFRISRQLVPLVVFLAGAAVLTPSPAAAAAAAEADLPGPFTAPSLVLGDADFLKGTWTLALYAGYDRECSSDPHIGYGAVGVGYFIFDYFSVNAEARLMGSSQDGEDAMLGALDVSIRHHIIRGEGWSIFVDASAGISQSSVRIPLGGTHFNFIEEAGVGGTYKLSDRCHLIGGVRYWHLSNARLHGGDENPGLNGIGAYVGVLFTF
jgi:hypothetical protein